MTTETGSEVGIGAHPFNETQSTQLDLVRITDTEQYILGKIQDAKAAIATCVSMPELKEMRAEATAIGVLAKQQRASLDVQNEAAGLKLCIERRIGTILKTLEKNQGAAAKAGDDKPPTLEEMGIDKSAADRWQKIASIPDEDFERYLEGCKLSKQEITQANALRIAKGQQLQNAGHSSDSNEHYTPKDIVECARRVLGKIDLDPASCEFANRVVQAETYFTIEDDGLSKEWFGNVFLNPPYGKAETDNASNKARWSGHLIAQYKNGKVEAAILVVNPDIGTSWFWRLWDFPICFTEKRVKFYNQDGVGKSPPRGGAGAIVYFGPKPELFAEVFSEIGVVILQVRKKNGAAEIAAEGTAA